MSDAPKLGWLARLKAGLARTSGALKESIGGIFTRRKLDAASLEELEEALIMADLGVETSASLVAKLRKERFGKDVTDTEVRESLAEAIAEVLEPWATPIPHREQHKPQVLLICGVNGTGKTTTVGKLAKQANDAGLKVVLAACDTFRAAAVEQLQVWGQRNRVPVITGKPGGDPAGLAFEALQKAQAERADLLVIDTAGRLHNKAALMDELKKIVRVLKKLDPEAPHDTILVLDATTGQNAHRQVETFKEMVQVSGLIVTKLDGTAKGGVVVALAQKYRLPVHAVGVGEGIDDLRPFEAKQFAASLLGLESFRGGRA
ncbi:MAG: signal recognition particle-docking protein FtsY [Geminicoccaceae bacterium]